jgi:death-on-curing family protein
VEENEPVYIELADALEFFAAIIEGTIGQAADQLRDQAGLESALGRPRNYAHYQEADLALQAAALAHGIAESQAFIDGNKRLALVSMLTFLEVNGYEVNATDRELANWIIGLSAGTTPEELAGLIRSRLQAVK